MENTGGVSSPSSSAAKSPSGATSWALIELLYETPFTGFDTKGVEGVFEHSDVVRLVQILRDIEPKFAA